MKMELWEIDPGRDASGQCQRSKDTTSRGVPFMRGKKTDRGPNERQVDDLFGAKEDPLDTDSSTSFNLEVKHFYRPFSPMLLICNAPTHYEFPPFK